ncbi:MAG: hypothetical protein CVV27_03820 [Candidatus Melainabacteria bacterium HGW-Melainabacteria-1]|nr:MAG: hypothetical protein CVV27_03820 [Candidatus Melainabacteria bacterium HGW-Melainabacteria-1]
MSLCAFGHRESENTLEGIIARIARINVLRALDSNRLDDDPYTFRLPLRLQAPEVLAEMAVPQLLLYLCLYGWPADLQAYLLLRLDAGGEPETVLPAALKQAAADTSVREGWYKTIDGFWEAHQLKDCRTSGRLAWPDVSGTPEAARHSTSVLLLTCLDAIQTPDDLLSFKWQIKIPELLQRLQPHFSELASRFEARDALLVRVFRSEFLAQAGKPEELEIVLSSLPTASKRMQAYWLKHRGEFDQAGQLKLLLALLEQADREIYLDLAQTIQLAPASLQHALNEAWLMPLAQPALEALLEHAGGLRLVLALLPHTVTKSVWDALLHSLTLASALEPMSANINGEQDAEILEIIYCLQANRFDEISLGIQDPAIVAELLERWCQGRYQKPLAESLNQLALDEPVQRHALWWRLLARLGRPYALPLRMLQWPPTQARACHSLSARIREQRLSWGSASRATSWAETLTDEDLDPLALLTALCQAPQLDSDALLPLLWLIEACLRLQRLEVARTITAWLQQPPGWPAPVLEQGLQTLRLAFGPATYEQCLRLLTDSYPSLQTDAQRLWLLRQLRQIRSSQVQKMLWAAHRQVHCQELSWLAGLALAQQGQKQIKPYLLSLGPKLCCYEGIAALCGIKEVRWATRLAWKMLETPNGNCPVDPDGQQVPLWLAALDAIHWFDLDRGQPRLIDIWLERPECRQRILKLYHDCQLMSEAWQRCAEHPHPEAWRFAEACLSYKPRLSHDE